MEIYCVPGKCLGWLGVRPENQVHTGFFLSSLLVLLLAPALMAVPHVCLFRMISGLPCPGCGITHSIVALFHFDFQAAWKANPAGLVVVLCLLYQLAARALAILRPGTGKMVTAFSRSLGMLP